MQGMADAPTNNLTHTSLSPHSLLSADPAWGSIPEQRRGEILERHEDNERSVTSSLLLCNETIHMIM